MRGKKNIQRSIFTGLLIFSCFLHPISSLSQPNLQTVKAATTQKTDYSKYPNTKYEWYFKRNKKHQPVTGGVPAGMKLSNYRAWYVNEKAEDKVIYLTFDCGYEMGYTKKLLETLKKHNAKAIFFVTKPFIKSNPELVKQMKDEGHLVGNHTSSHPSLPSKSVSAIQKEIKDCEKAFTDATGYKIDPFIRPPMGNFSKRTMKVTKDLGYKTIFWSMAYYDYDVNNQPGKDYVVNHFKENYHPGAIPLIHNVSQSNTEALDDVLTFLEKKGYRFGTLDEFTLKKGTLKIECPNKEYDGKAAKVKIVKNTNTDAKISYIFKNEKGKVIKKAVKPGTYTVTAQAASTWTHRAATSNTVTFTITEPVVEEPAETTEETKTEE